MSNFKFHEVDPNHYVAKSAHFIATLCKYYFKPDQINAKRTSLDTYYYIKSFTIPCWILSIRDHFTAKPYEFAYFYMIECLPFDLASESIDLILWPNESNIVKRSEKLLDEFGYI